MPRQEKLSLYRRIKQFLRRKKTRLKQAGWYPPPDPVEVPPEIEVLEMIGQGRRSCTYRARYRGEPVALKVYRRALVKRYRWRYGVNLAQFEYNRNRAFWANPALRPYTVEPLKLLGVNDGYSAAFVQAWAEGETLKERATRCGPIPAELLALGYHLVHTAHAAGLYDLDFNAGNIKLRRTATGELPLIYDFNLLPQHLYAPNPFRWLALRLGLRHPGYRDFAALEGWANLGLTQKQYHLL
ncbi:MAG TPA: hypothetical protein VNJ47_00640 [Nevskiales bacterium]|nr:hypothetical protein [Nevskiales bacterium]